MGGAFTPRTEAQKAAIPMPADATVALVAATCASISVAPFLMCVDRGVVAAAAGNAPGGSLPRHRRRRRRVRHQTKGGLRPTRGVDRRRRLRRHVLRQKLRRRPHRTPRPLRVPRGWHRQVLRDDSHQHGRKHPERRRLRAMVRRRRRRRRRACRHPKDLLRPLRRARLPHHQRRVRRPRRHARCASRARGRGGIRRGSRLAARLPAAHASRLHALTPPRAQSRQRPGGIRRRARRRAQGVHARRAPRQVASDAPGVRSRRIAQRRRDGEGRDVVAAVFAERSYKRLGHAMGTMSFGAFGRKTSAAGAASSSGEVSRRRRSVAGAPAGAARVSPAGTDARAAQVREHHACDGGCGGSNPNDGSGHGGGGRGARGSGNGRGGMGGAERTVSTKEVVGGGRGGGAEHLRAVGEVGGRAARERRGRMTRDSRVAGSFDAFVDARRRRPRTSKISRVRVIKHQQNPS